MRRPKRKRPNLEQRIQMQENRIAERRRKERKLGNYTESVRPNPNVPYGWPSDGTIPPWATPEEIKAYYQQQTRDEQRAMQRRRTERGE